MNENPKSKPLATTRNENPGKENTKSTKETNNKTVIAITRHEEP